jgi:hypothetical protein
VLSNDNGSVVDLLFDVPPITKIDYGYFVKMCNNVAKRYGKTIDWIDIGPSSTDKILQVQDYIAGTVGGHYEHENDLQHNVHELMDILSSRVRGK